MNPEVVKVLANHTRDANLVQFSHFWTSWNLMIIHIILFEVGR